MNPFSFFTLSTVQRRNVYMANLKVIASTVGMALDRRLPEILTGVGIVSMVTGTVLACNETPKAIQIMEHGKEELKLIEKTAQTAAANGGIIIRDDKQIQYSEKDHQKDVVISKTNCVKKVIKTYLPSGLCIGAGIVSICCGTGILRNRYTGAVLAAGALEEGFRKYRKNVIEAYGELADKKFRFGGVDEVVQHEYENENGETVTTETTETKFTDIPVDDPRVFVYNTQNSSVATGNILNDLNNIKVAQAHVQERVYMFGNSSVNYAREQLGGVDIPLGMTEGWAKDGPSGGKVDFGVFDAEGQPKAWVLDAFSKTGEIPLEFNTDGDIRALLTRPRNARN